MDQKNSTPINVKFEKAHSGQNGLFYIFEIEFQNGDHGKFYAPSELQDIFAVGIETEYTIEEKKQGSYTNYVIRPVKKSKFTGKKVDPVHENKRTALRCAVDLAAAGKIDVKDISRYCDSFLKFLQ